MDNHALIKHLASCRNALTRAAAVLEANSPADLAGEWGALDLKLRTVFEKLDALASVAELLRPPRIARYAPAEALRGVSAQFAVQGGEPGAKYDGDPDQVQRILRLIVENAAIGPAGGLDAALYTGPEDPRIHIAVMEPGVFSDPLALGPLGPLPDEAAAAWWARATGGGAFERRGTSFYLFLTGDAGPDESGAWTPPESAGKYAKSAARRLQPWRGAIGMFEEGLVAPEESKALYLKAIEGAAEDVEQAMASL